MDAALYGTSTGTGTGASTGAGTGTGTGATGPLVAYFSRALLRT